MNQVLSVVLPAHNEEMNIGKMLERLFECHPNEILEVLVVDDASTDHTAQRVEEASRRHPQVRLIRRQPPCGVGRALVAGFAQVGPRAQYVLTMDSDFLDNVDSIQAMIQRIEQGDCDGVIGSRFIEGSRLVGYSRQKLLANRAFHLVVRALFHLDQRDLSNNFKLYKREIIQTLPWKSHDFAMNAETGLLPIVAGYRIVEVPVTWIERTATMGISKFRIVRHGWSYLRVITYAWQLAGQWKRTAGATRRRPPR